MACSLLNKGFLAAWRPQVQAVRFRNRINIQRPRPPHFLRHRMLEACKPLYPPKPEYVCLKTIEKQETRETVDNPYERILAKEVRNWFDHSQFIGFLHMNPMKAEEKFKVFILMKREGVVMREYGRNVVARAINDSQYEPILQLYVSKNGLLFSESSKPVAKILKILKRVPQIVLMAGIVEGRLMSRSQLEKFAALPDLTMARAQLVSILAGAASPAAQLVSHLSTHQRTLVSHLEQRAEQLNPEKS